MATSASSSSTAVTIISSSSSAHDTTSSGNTIISINIAAQASLKLTATSYRSWKLQFHTVLIGFDLMGFVDGNCSCPPATITTDNTSTPNPAHHIWVRQDQLLLNAILSSISPSIIPFIVSAKTVHDAWTALANTYAKPFRGHIIHLKGVLTNISKGTQSITEYIQHAKSVADELAMLDAPENPEDLTVKILNGLGDEFKDISSIVRARDSAISFEELHEKLLNSEAFFKQNSTRIQRLPITANYVAKPSSGGHQSHNHNRNYNNRFSASHIATNSDNGGEYIVLRYTLASHGISHYTNPPHTPEHNSVSERRHRHIVETSLSLLTHASLPLTFWSYAFTTAVHLINRMPTPLLGMMSPFEKIFNTRPSYAKLRVFGCLCYPWIRPYNSHKLESRSKACIFIGYSLTQRAHHCLDMETSRIFVSRYVNFVESVFSHKTLHTSLPRSSATTSTNWLSNETLAVSVPVSHFHSSADMALHETPLQNPPSSSRAWAVHPQPSLPSLASLTAVPFQHTHMSPHNLTTHQPNQLHQTAPLHVAPVDQPISTTVHKIHAAPVTNFDQHSPITAPIAPPNLPATAPYSPTTAST
ncbi:hypothetical protein LWI28_018729 [Acer negundo]|uniref:Integrase catalytic domain-containing protein n=1 Tax=Acer negundo TaxID=4023 RepID=A0AAD5NRT4_ACENE|nr:hypothetical protein LWI28_018729 [Acer negundo]